MNEIARPNEQQRGLVVRNPEELQRWMLSVVNDPKRAKNFEGLIDRQSVFLAMSYVRQNWWSLSKCTPESIFESMLQAGAYGWTCDGITGHAYIVPFKDRATLMPGYKGLIDLVRRSGQCEVSIESVHEGDEYTYLGRFREPRHVRSKDPQRRSKPMTHAYAIAVFSSGIIKAFSWSKEECIEHRNRYSQGWRRVAGSPDKAKDNPWFEGHPGFPVMCMKTVLRNAINRGEVPISLRDNRGQQTLSVISEDDEPLTVESTAGFHDPLHVESQAAYSVGDDIAADAETHLNDQTTAFDPVADLRAAIECITDPKQAAELAPQAEELGLLDVLDAKITSLRKGKK